MPTWQDVTQIGARFPGLERSTSYGTPSLKVRNKFVCRLRTDPDALVMRVTDLGEKEALVQGEPGTFFSTPHYDGYPAVLINLDTVDRTELAELIEDAWRLQAPKRLVTEYEQQQRA